MAFEVFMDTVLNFFTEYMYHMTFSSLNSFEKVCRLFDSWILNRCRWLKSFCVYDMTEDLQVRLSDLALLS